MSEKLFSALLRLYPARFRQTYGDAALQLFRDRVRDERGFWSSLRLWLDLLADLAVSVPREHGRIRTARISASVQSRSGDMPSLHVLESQSPGFGALLLGSALSLVAVAASSMCIVHVASHRPRRGPVSYSAPPAHGRWSALSRPVTVADDDPEDETIVTGAPAMAAVLMLGMSPQRAAGEPELDAVVRQRVLDAVITNLKQHYVDRDAAGKIAEALAAHQKSGDDDAARDGAAFARLLTAQIRAVSRDMHLEVIYTRDRLPDHPAGPTAEARAAYRKAIEQANCTFERVEVLAHNIGYLKLNSFPDPAVCRATATAAMASLNHVRAIIFDLRDNRGGMPDMVAFIAAYLFDHPEYWYNPRENTTRESWTRSPVPGNNLADKPVYVLTSARTWSGAEQFSYDLKMLKRATLVGETTGGGAHAGVFYRIDDHFGMAIREVSPINPFSTADWEGVGVEPDVQVNAADALETAVKLVENKLRKN